MSSRQNVHTERAPAPFGGAPYSQAMISGDLVFASGQVGLDPATGSLVDGGVAEQTDPGAEEPRRRCSRRAAARSIACSRRRSS